MFVEILAASLCGVLLGTLTGLTPGLHINTVSLILIGLYHKLSIPPLYLAAVIFSMAITHTFVDCIPSLVIGVPDTAYAFLPQHKLIRKGLGYEAVKLTVVGGLFSIAVLVVLAPVIGGFIFALSRVKMVFPLLVFAVLVYSILDEGRKTVALLVAGSAGLLGHFVLNSQLRDPLFLLFTGLFGISSCVMGLFSEPPPKQVISRRIFVRRKQLWSVVMGTAASAFCTLLPGLGSAHAAFIIGKFQDASSDSYLLTVGAINTVNAFTAILVLFLLDKSRTGFAVVLSRLGYLAFDSALFLIAVGVAASGIAAFLTLRLGRFFLRRFHKVNVVWLAAVVIFFLVVLAVVMSGPAGLLVLVVSSSLGMLAHVLKVRKSNLMAALIIPILWSFI